MKSEFNLIRLFRTLLTIVGISAFIMLVSDLVKNTFFSTKTDLYNITTTQFLREMSDENLKRIEVIHLVEKLEERLNNIIFISENGDSLNVVEGKELINVTSLLNSNQQRLSSLNLQFEGLRQAINPSNPEEILTIARLKDEIITQKQDLINFKQSILEKQEQFIGYILREKESSNRGNNLIMVVLIPLVLNFLYTVWKDMKKDKKEEKIETR